MPPPVPPERLLFIRPDTYGDLVLFEPALRLVREAWPQTEVAVLIREPYADLAPLMPAGVRWLTTRCNPYRLGPSDCRKELEELRGTIHAFAPDWLVAPCFQQTWLEYAVASFVPEARQVRMGGPPVELEPGTASQSLFPEAVAVEETSLDWEKNLRLASFLLEAETERPLPRVFIPENPRDRAQGILDEQGLVRGEFIACAAAGTANVACKSWPAQAYGETLAWLEREHGRRALLIGHASERERLGSVAEAARAGGAHPALWLGEDGEIALLGGLIEASGAYFGNDTGALHLAAALGRPVAAVFGGGTWPRFKPVAVRAVSVVQPLPCFGCGWDCYFEDAPCLRTIAMHHVRNALDVLLKDETAPPRVIETQDLDASARGLIAAVTPRLRFQKADGASRLRQVHELTAQMISLENVRLAETAELTALLKASQAHADARLTQVTELTALLKTTQTDADMRLTQVTELTALLKATQADASARLTQVTELTALLKAARADADERMPQITDLTAQLAEIRGHADARMVQIEQLTAWLLECQADRNAKASVIENLTQRIAAGNHSDSAGAASPAGAES